MNHLVSYEAQARQAEWRVQHFRRAALTDSRPRRYLSVCRGPTLSRLRYIKASKEVVIKPGR